MDQNMQGSISLNTILLAKSFLLKSKSRKEKKRKKTLPQVKFWEDGMT